MAEHVRPEHSGLSGKLARLAAALGLAAAASVAVSAVAGAAGTATIQLSSTSAKATQVTYTIGFTSPGALASGTGTMTLSAPSGTTFASSNCDYSIYNATSTRTGGCPLVTVGSGGKSVTIASNITIAKGNAVVLTVEGVANPSKAGSDSLTVTTNAGGSLAAPFTLTTPTGVSGLALTASSTSAGASQVTDVLTFTATNALTTGMSQIVVTGPAGSVFASTGCLYTLYDAASERTSGCLPVSVTGGHTVAVTPEMPTTAGDQLRLTIEGVTNPAATGSDSVTVHTTSDPVNTSVAFDVTPATAVSKLSFTTSAKGAGATAVTDQVSFVPSNSLTSGRSQVTLTLPTGSTLPTNGCDYDVYNTSTHHGASCSSVTVSKSGNGATITVNTPVASGVLTDVTVEDLSNPVAKQSGTLAVSTTSDPTIVTVADDTVAATAVTSFTLSANAHAISATGVSYTAKFTATDGLTDGTSQVTLTAPAGTVLPASACGTYVLEDLTTQRSNGCLAATVSGNVAVVTVGVTVNPGNVVELVANNVTSATTTGSHSVSISTTSDTAKVSGTLSLTAPTKVKGFTFSSNDTSAGALRATYTLSFTIVGGLDRTFGRIVVSVPSGMSLPTAGCSYEVTDDTTGQGNGCVAATVSGDTASIQAGVTVNPGDKVTVLIRKVDNPAAAGKDSIKLSTSSDAGEASTVFQVKAEAALKDVTLTATSHDAGAKGVSYKVTFIVTGSLTANTSTITVTATTGATTVTFTTGTGGGCRITNGDTTSGTSWACAGGTPSTTGTGITVTPDENGSTGNAFYIIINNVKNPTKVGTATFRIHSSFDPKPVKVSLPITSATAVKSLSFKASSYSANATDVTYSATFKATNGLTERYSTITLAAPTGTVLPVNTGCSVYYVTDVTNGANGSCETVTLLNGGTTAVIKLPIGVRPGDAVNVTVYGVSNPTAAGSGTVSITTSSDTKPATTPFTITAPSKVSSPTLTVTGTTSPYKATIGFVATNGLTARYSKISLTAPSGTTLPTNGCDYTVDDTTDGASGGCPAVQGTGATTTLTLPVTIRPGDSVQVVVETVTGTKPSKMTVSTTSDPTTVSA